MKSEQQEIEQHYHADNVLQAILDGLTELGKDINCLSNKDLMAVDAFHIRGRAATIELAEKASIQSGQSVLDIGCALGGSARFLADKFSCLVHGIDITASYIDAAIELGKRTGFDKRVFFQQASALALPFEPAYFDRVWTEHVQMNIADKTTFYGEISRVLKPGGYLLFHDVFQTSQQQLCYPVPWADSADINHLISPQDAQKVLQTSDLQVVEWQDKTSQSLEWLLASRDKIKEMATSAVGLHLLMGSNIVEKTNNIVRNIEQGNIVIVQGLAQKNS